MTSLPTIPHPFVLSLSKHVRNGRLSRGPFDCLLAAGAQDVLRQAQAERAFVPEVIIA